MGEVKFYLRNPVKGKKCGIYASVYINGKRQTPFSTGQFSKPEEWAKNKYRPGRLHPRREWLTKFLDSLEKEIWEYFEKAPIPHSLEGLKNYLNEEPESTLLHDLARSHYGNKGVKKQTQGYYDNFLGFLERNTKNIPIDQFDEKQWKKFRTVTKKKLKFSTRQAYEKHVKTILRKAFQKGLSNNRSFFTFEISKQNERLENKPILTLSKDELEQLIQIEFSRPNRNWMRDMTYLFCHLGLRFVDWDFGPNHFEDNKRFLRIITQKTNVEVVLPVLPQAKRILEKYNWTIEPHSKTQISYAFKQMMSEAKDHISSLRKQIPYVDQEGKKQKQEKWQMLTPYVMRRTYATYMYKNSKKLNLPLRSVMRLTGHTSEKVFFKYIGIQNLEVAQDIMDNLDKLD